MKITFLHTSYGHVDRFESIVKSIDNSAQTEHHVIEELLSYAKNNGDVDTKGFNEQLIKIRNENEGRIICTCSTYGALCNEDEEVYRIDKPIVKYVVENYSKIGIAYTIESTKKVSKALLEEVASKTHRSIEMIEINCLSSWDWFEKGDLSKYERSIATQFKKLADNCEVIFLAQASMEGAKKYLSKEKYEVVSSPQYGVETFLAHTK